MWGGGARADAHRTQRSTSAAVPQLLTALFLEIVSFIGLELAGWSMIPKDHWFPPSQH